MGRTGSHEEMVSLTPKTQWISLIKMSGPVLLACELTVDCWEVLYLFIYLKMAILMICYYLGFFPLAVRPCWGHSPGPQGVWPTLCRGCPFPWQPALCVLQLPSPLPVNIHIQLILTWSLELFEMSCLGKERLWALLSGGIWASVRSLLRVLAVAGTPTLAQSSWDHGTGKGTEHICLLWMDRVCSHNNSCVLLGGPFWLLGYAAVVFLLW